MGFTPLYLAVVKNNAPCAKALLEKSANPDYECLPNFGICSVPLHAALNNGSLECARLLIERGADVKKESRLGATTLHCCAFREVCADCIPELLNKGVDPNKKDACGFTPLHRAVIGNNVGFIQVLFENSTSVDPNCTDMSGNTPLDLCKNSEIKKLLEDYGRKRNK